MNTESRVPIYKQIQTLITEAIKSGEYKPGDILPSMNELAVKTGISKETVKKAYASLRDEGVIVPRQGKGFYVNDNSSDGKTSVLVLFDKLSIYKQVLFNSFSSSLGACANTTILTHNQDLNLLEYYLGNNLDNYDYYVITPHFPLDRESQARAVKLLKKVPTRKLILLDKKMDALKGNYGCVYQDFENDVSEGLRQGLRGLRESSRLEVLTLESSLYGHLMESSVKKFCKENGIPVSFRKGVPDKITENTTYLILNSQIDLGLTDLARKAKDQNLVIGKDIKIISYNEFPLNEVILGGLTTISTDFEEMGRLAAGMILSRKLYKTHCPFKMTRRATF